MAFKEIITTSNGDVYATAPTTSGGVAVNAIALQYNDSTSTGNLIMAIDKARIAILDAKADL